MERWHKSGQNGGQSRTLSKNRAKSFNLDLVRFRCQNIIQSFIQTYTFAKAISVSLRLETSVPDNTFVFHNRLKYVQFLLIPLRKLSEIFVPPYLGTPL